MHSETTDSSRPLVRVGLRYLRRHPWQTALMILGVMLGVAVMVAIDLANAAASRAFDLSTDAIAGKATHQIVGGPTGLDEAIYTRLRVEGGVRLAAPVVTDYVSSPQLGDRPIQLLGVDPFAEAPFRSYLLTGNAARATGFGRETSPDGATVGRVADRVPDPSGRAADLRGAGARERARRRRPGGVDRRRPPDHGERGRAAATRRFPQPPRARRADPGRHRHRAGDRGPASASSMPSI